MKRSDNGGTADETATESEDCSKSTKTNTDNDSEEDGQKAKSDSGNTRVSVKSENKTYDDKKGDENKSEDINSKEDTKMSTNHKTTSGRKSSSHALSKTKNTFNHLSKIEGLSKVLEKQEELLADLYQEMEELKHQQQSVRPCKSCEFPRPMYTLQTTSCFGLRSSKVAQKLHTIWIVSSPAEDEHLVGWDKLNVATKDLSANYKFHIPKLKVGGMNQLMSLIDDLVKLDDRCEIFIQNLIQFTREIGEGREDLLTELHVSDVDIETHITRFTWNLEKYPIEKSLVEFYQIIGGEVNDMESNLKTRQSEYKQMHFVSTKNVKQEKSIQSRSLKGIVRQEDVILESKILVTLLVVVPNNFENQWLASYQTLSDMVIPDSSSKLYEDESYCLFTVVLHRKFEEDFRAEAKKKHFHIRQYETEEDDEERKQMGTTILKVDKSQRSTLITWIYVTIIKGVENFLHVKALRTFIESILRFGIPPDFHANLLVPLKSEKKLRDCLQVLYKDLDCSLSSNKMTDCPGSLTRYNVTEYYPYVFLTINTDMFHDRPKLKK